LVNCVALLIFRNLELLGAADQGVQHHKSRRQKTAALTIAAITCGQAIRTLELRDRHARDPPEWRRKPDRTGLGFQRVTPSRATQT